MAQHAIESINGVGVFGVELFELENGELFINEICPYPPNAGYLTIEGMITSQFENHIRAVMGLPLGDVDQIAPATAMVNILAERHSIPHADILKDALAIGGAHIHWYGKSQAQPGQKMGHITVLGYTADGAEKVGRLALSKIRL
jgi:5-(carboxyamino)imidazole ribonucleotide synthase